MNTALMFCCAKASKVGAISLALLALTTASSCPKRSVATCAFLVSDSVTESFGSTRKPITAALGTSW
jgi:hypothetical protein